MDVALSGLRPLGRVAPTQLEEPASLEAIRGQVAALAPVSPLYALPAVRLEAPTAMLAPAMTIPIEVNLPTSLRLRIPAAAAGPWADAALALPASPSATGEAIDRVRQPVPEVRLPAERNDFGRAKIAAVPTNATRPPAAVPPAPAEMASPTLRFAMAAPEGRSSVTLVFPDGARSPEIAYALWAPGPSAAAPDVVSAKPKSTETARPRADRKSERPQRSSRPQPSSLPAPAKAATGVSERTVEGMLRNQLLGN